MKIWYDDHCPQRKRGIQCILYTYTAALLGGMRADQTAVYTQAEMAGLEQKLMAVRERTRESENSIRTSRE
jgi:hypothetical protein